MSTTVSTLPYDPAEYDRPAATRLYRCSDYPRRVRAESADQAAHIVARYLARQRYGRAARPWGPRQDGWDQDRATGQAVAWHYEATIVGRGSPASGYPILGRARFVIRRD
jgi:hypothetical protein